MLFCQKRAFYVVSGLKRVQSIRFSAFLSKTDINVQAYHNRKVIIEATKRMV